MREPRRIHCAPFCGGFSFGAGRASKKQSGTFDPSTLSLTGWWRANASEYDGSPWVGEAGGNLTEATNPPSAGTAVNGFVPADFDGTNDILAGSAISTFYGATGTPHSGCCLVFVDTAAAALAAAASRNTNNAIVTDGSSSGYWGITVGTDGVAAYVFDGSYKDVIVSTDIRGAWNWVQWKLTGGTLSLRVNGGSWADYGGTVTDIDVVTGAITLANGFGAARGDFKILELMTKNAVISDADFNSIRTSYGNSRYGLSL